MRMKTKADGLPIAMQSVRHYLIWGGGNELRKQGFVFFSTLKPFLTNPLKKKVLTVGFLFIQY